MPYDPLTAASPGTGLAYAPSYWTATAGDSPADDGQLRGATEADVAIVGGGYTGLSCAYHLARHYGLRAIVLEANRPGWGCSGRNGGFARAAVGRYSFGKMMELWGRDTARRVFGQALAGVENVRAIIREGSIECDALEAGHLKIAHQPNRAKALEREAHLLQREFEYPAEFLSTAQVRAAHIGGPQSHGALRFPDAIAVHPLKLAFGVLGMARRAGAKVHGVSPVLALTKTGHTHVLSTPTGTVRTGTIVLATNGYTPEHLHDCVRSTTLPVLSHIIVTRPMTPAEKTASAFHTGHVLTDTRNLLYYWRRLPDDRVLFGGRGQITENGTSRAREFLLAALKAKLPALEKITVEHDWWGWVCLTADFLPHVYHARDDATVHYAIGYQGSGVSHALYAGRQIASRIANDAQDEPALPTTSALPRFPFASLRRIGQRAMYRWYRYLDNRV